MDIRLYGLERESIVDGPGVRMAVFVQGCKRNCPGCHNPDSHDLMGGYVANVESICKMMKRDPLLTGLTLSGGEPFLQVEQCLPLVRTAHELGLNVWCYTGDTWENLMQFSYCRLLLSEVDILVDGPFVQAEKSLELKFKGSRNQRIIDVKESVWSGEIVLWKG